MSRLAATLSRHWPFNNGSGRILDKFAQGVDLGSGEHTTTTSDGFSITVFSDDLIGRHILLSGKFDRSIVQVLLDQARPGDTLLDIGANIGYVSACFLQQVKNSAAICIEPQPGVVDLLKSNIAQFGARAVVYPVALSDTPGELRFHVNPSNRGASRISDDGEIVVSAVDAAKLLASLERVDLIKIDVEGHELPIFRAIEDQLKRLQPRAILFEDHGTAASSDGPIGSILKHCGYLVYGINKRLLKTQLVPVSSASDCRFNDYIAVASAS